ncbi:hypothetical protein HNQ91_002845 [Filimonas zeae]|uniref:Lipoprotein n=1 Tax=Filimonas zeae TaxID=1737353 RepID=A0A917MYB2_9BACT|nr:hypothetical protein [Filimonas zeae]MDR6339780.1 hypothetical protein [Filimonas zeae]GGH69600.1 hypothetical protein GCM10011379_27080 [Filimonas zeae]
MKSTLFILIPFFIISCNNSSADAVHQKTPDSATAIAGKPGSSAETTVETIITDFNNDGVKDSLALQSPPVAGDPGQFSRIRLRISGLPEQSFTCADVWDYIDSSFTQPNAVASKRIYAYKHHQYTYLLLFGFLYGSGRDNFDIIRIGNGQIKKIFSQAIQEAIALQPMGSDGKLCFIGRPIAETDQDTPDSTSGATSTQSSYIVYELSDTSKIDILLTTAYNLSH